MATNVYNKAPADTETVKAGTTLYRILPLTAKYQPNSYNTRPPRPIGDPTQGRFEPVDDTLGGYLYVAQSVAGAIAEGVLRGEEIRSPIVRRIWLTGKKLATMHLEEDIEVASLYGPSTAKLNLSGALLCSADYNLTRQTGSDILTATSRAQGLKYRCVNHDDLTSLMLISRTSSPRITVDEEVDIFFDTSGRKLVLETLKDEFGLSYTGTFE